jgi:hypothetical protein
MIFPFRLPVIPGGIDLSSAINAKSGPAENQACLRPQAPEPARNAHKEGAFASSYARIQAKHTDA